MATVAATIIVSAIASKAAMEVITSIGEAIGLHENDINNLALIGGVAAGYMAGSATYEAMSAPASVVSTVPTVNVPDVTNPTVGLTASEPAINVAANIPAAPGTPPVVAPTPPLANMPPSTPIQSTTNISPEVSPSVIKPDVPWYESMWNSDRTGDVIVGAASGMAMGAMQADALEDQRDYEEGKRQKYNTAWANADPSMFPSIQRPTVNAPSAPTVKRAGMLSKNTKN